MQLLEQISSGSFRRMIGVHQPHTLCDVISFIEVCDLKLSITFEGCACIAVGLTLLYHQHYADCQAKSLLSDRN